MKVAVALGVLLLAIGGVASGCGGSDGGGDEAAVETETTAGGSPVDGAAVYEDAGCGGCHTLAAAGSAGSVGPNLDDLQPDAETVANQVRNGGGAMPSFSDSLDEDEIQAVAEYVATNAGQ